MKNDDKVSVLISFRDTRKDGTSLYREIVTNFYKRNELETLLKEEKFILSTDPCPLSWKENIGNRKSIMVNRLNKDFGFFLLRDLAIDNMDPVPVLQHYKYTKKKGIHCYV